MTPELFNQILENRLDKTRSVLSSKAKEYAVGADRLSNFKRAGAMLKQAPEQALIGMWTKHIISILDIVDEIDNGKIPTIEILEEKITDAVSYLILLEALMCERIKNNSI